MNSLPASIGARPYTSTYKGTALIYAFERPTREHEAVVRVPGLLTGRVHLEKARLWQRLRD